MKPLITIVIPVHNRAEIAERTLRSVEAQTLRPLRVILVDNNSTDSTPSVLARWKERVQQPDFIVDIFLETTPGAAAARNRGLREVESKYTMFFDSDDTMEPHHVEKALKGFSHPSHPDVVGWDICELTPSGKLRTRRFSAHDALWHCIMHGSMATQRYAARTSLFREAGGWNERMRGWDDIELGARILALCPRILKQHGDSGRVTVRFTEQSITGTSFAQSAGQWEAALDAIETTVRTPRHKSWIRLRRSHLAGLYVAEGRHDFAEQLMANSLHSEPSAIRRVTMRVCAALTSHHVPGAMRLLRPFF